MSADTIVEVQSEQMTSLGAKLRMFQDVGSRIVRIFRWYHCHRSFYHLSRAFLLRNDRWLLLLLLFDKLMSSLISAFFCFNNEEESPFFLRRAAVVNAKAPKWFLVHVHPSCVDQPLRKDEGNNSALSLNRNVITSSVVAVWVTILMLAPQEWWWWIEMMNHVFGDEDKSWHIEWNAEQPLVRLVDRALLVHSRVLYGGSRRPLFLTGP